MTSIEWTNETWNVITGCSKVSAGCAHCYAETIANRFWGDRKFTDVQFHPERLDQPLKWRKPRMVFVNSMSDLFHESVTDEQLNQIFAVMALTPQHTYQVLTKRPERMLEYMQKLDLRKVINAAADLDLFMPNDNYSLQIPLSNIWLGVTVENQKAADERIPLLLQTPAAVRFLSCEPLLEAVDLTDITSGDAGQVGGEWHFNCLSLEEYEPEDDDDFGGSLINWVIVGGESGPKARVCDSDWIKSIVEQCQEADVACFVKQFGSHRLVEIRNLDHPDVATKGIHYRMTGKGANPEEWPEWARVREFPKVEVTV